MLISRIVLSNKRTLWKPHINLWGGKTNMCFRARLKIREGGEGFWLAHLMCQDYPPNSRFPTLKFFRTQIGFNGRFARVVSYVVPSAYPGHLSTAGSNERFPNCRVEKIAAIDPSWLEVAACQMSVFGHVFGHVTGEFGTGRCSCFVYCVFSPRLRIHMYICQIEMFSDRSYEPTRKC